MAREVGLFFAPPVQLHQCAESRLILTRKFFRRLVMQAAQKVSFFLRQPE